MSIKETTEGDVTVLELSDVLVLGPAEDEFRRTMDRLIAADQLNIVLDLRKVEMIDSSGVGALVKYLTTLTRNGGKLKCTLTTPPVEKVLKITGVYDLFDFYPNQKEAVAAF